MKKISWKKFFILLSFWDTAVFLHFWVNFKMAGRGPERVTSHVFWSFLLPKNFSAPTVHNSEDRGGMKMPYDFLFTFVTFSKQTAGLEKKFYSMEWPANKDERVDRPNITVYWTGTKLTLWDCSTHGYYNLTKFHQNRIKNKIFLLLGHFL